MTSNFQDYSVKEPFDSRNAEYIRGRIRELIRGVSVTICLVGESTYTSRWVTWELNESIKLGKGLLGVRLFRAESHKIPKLLTDHRAQVMGWEPERIVEAIERAAIRAGY